MADIWPIENVWAILRQRLGVNDFATTEKLKKGIIREWAKFTPELCQNLISSIGRRLKAVVKKNGEQVTKKIYE